jgi:two-component sensor histidine kinase
MAMVHQKLYEGKDLTNIQLDEFIQDLIILLIDSYEINPGHIKIKTDLQRVTVNLETAIPCVLILNELITNSIKHAFPDGSGGTISIGLSTGAGYINMEIADDGIGFGELESSEVQTLGIRTVNSLVEQQLEGSIEFRKEEGARVTLKFPYTDDC